MSFLGTWLGDLPRPREQVPRDWHSRDCPGFVLWPAAAPLRWTPRRLPRPGSGHSTPGAGTCPESGSLFFIPRPFSPFPRPLRASTPCSQLHSDPIVCRDVQIPGPPAWPGGRPPGPSALVCTASLALAPSLQAARAPGGPGAALPDPQPSKLELDSASPRAPSRLPLPAA